MSRQTICLLCFLLLSFVVSGCGADGPEIATVHGKVTMDGQPLPNASVVFVAPGSRPAGARTDENGEYVLNFSGGRQGAVPGTNRVQISTLSDPYEDNEGNWVPASPETVPLKYNTGSELEFVVEAGKENIANFDLDSEGPLPDNEIDPAEARLTPEEEQAARDAARGD